MSDLTFGLQITAWGMGLVFGLLGLLWGLLALVGSLETRAAARPVTPADLPPVAAAPGEAGASDEPVALTLAAAAPGAPALRVTGPGADELPPEALAAISAAVLAHAANRRRQAAPEMRSFAPGSHLFASRWVIAGRTRQNRGYRGERR